MGNSSEQLREVKRDRNGFVRCRVCGCTEVDACADGCGWADTDLCTTCDRAAQAIVAWGFDARRPTWAALRREAERQQGIVAANRAETTEHARRPRAVAAGKGGAR